MRQRRIGWLLIGLVTMALSIYWVGSDLLGLWFPVRLPWQVYQQEYAPPAVTLRGADQEQVIRSIFSDWLNCYRSGQTDPMARLRDFRVDAVSDIQATDHGFVAMVEFSVRPYGRPPQAVDLGSTLAELRTYWVSGNGVLRDGWVQQKVLFAWIDRQGDTYVIENLSSSPPELDGLR